MARQGENIRRRKDGRWEGRVINPKGTNGRKECKSFYGKSYEDVKEKMSTAVTPDIRRDAAERGLPDRVGLYTTALDNWLAHYQSRIKDSSYAKYHNLINNHIKPLLGQYAVTDVSNKTVNEFADSMLTSGRRGTSGLSVSTVRDMLFIIKAALNFTQHDNERNIRVKLPRADVKDIRVLTRPEQAALERCLYDKMDNSKLGVLLCLYTGIRLGEVCALRWSDFDFNGEYSSMTVHRTIQRIQMPNARGSAKTRVIESSPKSVRSIRIIPLPECLYAPLRRFYSDNGAAYLLTGKVNKYIEPRAYEYKFKAYVTACGLGGVNFHATRHTFATRCVELGFDPKSLSEILGHSDIKITLERYVHPTFTMKRQYMNKLTALTLG